jgi:hypothetical protein
MKKTLWTYGDSFTESLNTTKGALWVDKYVAWKGYIPRVYGEIISDEMGMELVNLGRGGSDNYSIFQSVCDSANLINSNDVIIIGWSSCTRFRLVDKWDNWKPIIPMFDGNIRNLEDVSNTTLEEVLINRTKTKYASEVHSWIKLLNIAFPNNLIIHWSPLDRIVSKNYIGNVTNITKETNEEIVNGHYGEVGHIQLANEFIRMIKSNTNIKLI